ncbi:hypothetical protein GWI33_020857 [Rhynchophorus ferrugineus]|uniref:Uncharacterized protein n=1 Tax=Rhynchophorus ferrugineus TaxID=354439 RepID=A0A834HPZ9_RHYFE|nr:hypothetical protein GWI33_020857 [Rhynchophorus ferrugineus]
MLVNVRFYTACVLLLHVIPLKGAPQNKVLDNDDQEERTFGRRKRPGFAGNQGGNSPCKFGGGYGKANDQPSGRTFFDLSYFNLENNYNLNIDCSEHGGTYPNYPAPVNEIHDEDHGFGGHKPFGGGGHKPGGHRPPYGGNHKPPYYGGHHRPPHGGNHRPPHGGNHRPPHGGFGGGNHKPGGGSFGFFFGGGNKPYRPHDGNDQESSTAEDGPYRPQNGGGEYNGPFAGIFPSPQQFAVGLSDGIQSFIGTLPAIAQSFQSLLPSFDNFQLPSLPQFSFGGNPTLFPSISQGGGSSSGLSNPFNKPPTPATITSTFPPVVIATTTEPTTTTDPDDIIFNDEIKPVQEDYDPILDRYRNKLPPGGQYLVVSNPHLGSYTQDLSVFNPTNIYNKLHQGIQGALEEFASYF